MNRTTDQPEPNPLREGLSRGPSRSLRDRDFRRDRRPDPSQTSPRSLQHRGGRRASAGGCVVGFARRPKTDDEFRRKIEEATRKYSAANGARRNLETLCQIDLLSPERIRDEEGYKTLAKRLDKIDQDHGTRGNRLFYFAASPEQFEPILKNLKAAGLNQPAKAAGRA